MSTPVVSKLTKASVTNFLYIGDYYLFIIRNSDSSVMPSQVNGIGGKLNKGEDYVSAAIRETQEETGYKVRQKDIRFCGIIKFENSGGDDWYTCFFKIQVPTKRIPIGKRINEGRLLWIHKNKVLKGKHAWADDLNYVFDDVIDGKKLFFLTVGVMDNNFKIVESCKSKI
ncbi:hypothetical protein A2115_02670 [Candidatus Woesebacteria bacterium GWA1_41_8]|uniref:Nudix hydrolase domain-containing protein n=1 Tax=Candidatus Woesebacteria bacterium GWA1_41_8 TaxID=1802471 RepID=A0A1F7WI20_9BACT|nr:MAG: hypothetical protein A2115_02670 [Candidatus Woesebacteria bacterium GWA1_41_8]